MAEEGGVVGWTGREKKYATTRKHILLYSQFTNQRVRREKETIFFLEKKMFRKSRSLPHSAPAIFESAIISQMQMCTTTAITERKHKS